jgi:hypothetical protein
MSQDFQLLMLGAMYENGGNTTHRFLDGHPELFVYPFESQIGTRLVQDHMTSLFPVKYRWPAFPLDGTPAGDYHLIIDEEGKVRSRTPNVSKFRDWPFEMNDDERKARYVEIVGKTGRSRANNMAAFFRATFDVWKDYKRSGKEHVWVGYSPIIGVDGDKILGDWPSAHVLHVVRNPWSAYADTTRRPVPLPLESYMLGWTLNQYFACLFRERFPGRFHVVRAEDVMRDSVGTLTPVLAKMGVGSAESLKKPTWNGNELGTVYPWGTIRTPTPDANKAEAERLSPAVRDEIRQRTWQYLETFDYKSFFDGK